jgi:thiamine-monophosphate kinase
MPSAESDFISALRNIATDPAARSLIDDAAVLEVGGQRLVLTKDLMVEGVHYRSDDPPADVAWKLLAVNLSDLAAKAARPVGVLLGFTLGDAAWDRAFAEGLGDALKAMNIPLLGGDTVGAAGPRVLSLTAIGDAAGPVPSRAGAGEGDLLWVSGTIGDAGVGLAMLAGELAGDEALIGRYRRPQPRLEAGQALGAVVSAMMDVSDGLLIDAARLGQASKLRVILDLDRVPLSQGLLRALGDHREARLRAATAGDDYELLFAAPEASSARILALTGEVGLALTRIGTLAPGTGLQIFDGQGEVPVPERLGYEHGGG